MTYNIQMQSAGLILTLVLIIIFFGKKRLKTFQNKIFSVLLLITLLQLVFDVTSVITIVRRAEMPLLNMFFSKGYLYAMCAYIFLIDIYALSNTVYEGMPVWRKKAKYITAGLLVAGLAAAYIAISVSELLFAGEGFAVYSYGAASDTVYLFSSVSVGFVIVIMLLNFRHVPIKRQLSFYAFCTMEGAVAIVQMFNKELLIIGFGTAITVLIMYFTLENPDLKMIAELERAKEKEEAARQEADKANKAKSEFLAQMSHEIRTPINAVLGMNELILREAKDDSILYYASNAYNSGKALLSIINDILDISKIEAGKLDIIESEYDLYSLVSDCYHMTANRAEKKKLLFTYTVEETLPVKLCGDMFHIRQIAVNFITNAIKYTDTGSIELIFSGERNADNNELELKIQVKDSGIGLTEESKQKMFTNFQRFDLKRNQTVEGTGLGLSICKQLAELMHGSVGVESVYGKGSTFFCVVPQKIIDNSPVGEVKLEHLLENNGLKERKHFVAPTARILVVDDVEMNLIVFSNLLNENDIQIEEASSGKQCLEMIKNQTYDIIFMDHMMPKMDGIETFERMKNMEHLNKNTPVVMLTANVVSGEKEKYLAAGFSSYLAKPIQSDKLEDCLLEYLPKEKVVWKEKQENKTGGLILPNIDSELLDIGLGLNYAGNKESAYKTILESYVKRGIETFEKIKQLYDGESWKDYVTQVHALKSVSLTVGAKQLSEMAKELESAGKAENYETIKQKNGAMLELYTKVLEVAAEALEAIKEKSNEKQQDGDAQTKKTEIGKEQLEEYAKGLKDGADRFDSDAIVALCKQLSACSYNGIDLAAKFEKVIEAAEDFECEQAGQLAQEIFSKLL